MDASSKNSHHFSLTLKILIGMLLGLFAGLLLMHVEFPGPLKNFLITVVFDGGGKIFISLLKLLVVPLVFVSITHGAASLENITLLGKIGFKTFILYILTTMAALGGSMFLANLTRPGVGLNLVSESTFQAKDPPGILDTLLNIIPTNPLRSLADGEMLQIIFFGIFLGIGLVITGEAGRRIKLVFSDLEAVLLKMVTMTLAFAPIGVFCLMAKVFSTQGLEAIIPLGKYFLTVVVALIIHCFLFYPIFLKILTGLSPFQFFRKFRSVFMFAFSTSSSNATIPVTLENVTKKLGVSSRVASFSIPLGATINMDGTAIMQAVATIFIAQVYQIDIGLQGQMMVLLTATLASIGTAGVPGAGLITLAMVLKQVNLPVEGIALIIGVDRLLDMARTVVNVSGDAMVSVIVAKHEGELDYQIYSHYGKEDEELA